MIETRNRSTVGRSGISVIEAVIAVMIVAMMLAAAYPAVTQAQYTVRRGRDHYLATALCLATIEQARKQEFTLLPRMAESQRLINEQGNYDGAGNFRRTIIVRPATPVEGLTEVSVDVEIRDRRTGLFRGETEHMASLFTTYLKVR
jgi:type II secretory pathway pseudopilin PulG